MCIPSSGTTWNSQSRWFHLKDTTQKIQIITMDIREQLEGKQENEVKHNSPQIWTSKWCNNMIFSLWCMCKRCGIAESLVSRWSKYEGTVLFEPLLLQVLRKRGLNKYSYVIVTGQVPSLTGPEPYQLIPTCHTLEQLLQLNCIYTHHVDASK